MSYEGTDHDHEVLK